ncbi:two-component system response regulator [Streptomyces sp. NPDC050504]|uniref:two-component system response regulator n=1 Tax=Streptomyces sp. NPDC050504 TaxID=3365618 RepID=UPI0037A04BC6
MAGTGSILLVDDQEDNLFALHSVLETLGRPIVRASDGEEALRVALRQEISVAVLDVIMPLMDGVEVLRYLKRLEPTQHIPVVLLTGIGRDDTLAAKAYEYGVADYLVKPIDPWSLRAEVRALADLCDRTAELARENRQLREQVSHLVAVPRQPTPAERARLTEELLRSGHLAPGHRTS